MPTMQLLDFPICRHSVIRTGVGQGRVLLRFFCFLIYFLFFFSLGYMVFIWGGDGLWVVFLWMAVLVFGNEGMGVFFLFFG